MIVLRFKVQCRPEALDEALSAFREVVAPSRALEGVVSFDIAQDLVDPTVIVATEVFEDREALERQESQPEVARVLELLPEVAASEPDVTEYVAQRSETPS